MKWLKLFDIAGQLLITILAYLEWNHRFYLWEWDAISFCTFYFGVGSWQAISCLVHAISIPAKKRNLSRRAYEKVLIVILIMGVFIYPLMLYIGPAMALWYFVTCLYELVIKNNTKDLETI